MKRVPKHIKAKIERTNRLMETIIDLNIEVEEWIEGNTGIDDAFDFTSDYRDDRGYGINQVAEFIDRIESEVM